MHFGEHDIQWRGNVHKAVTSYFDSQLMGVGDIEKRNNSHPEFHKVSTYQIIVCKRLLSPIDMDAIRRKIWFGIVLGKINWD